MEMTIYLSVIVLSLSAISCVIIINRGKNERLELTVKDNMRAELHAKEMLALQFEFDLELIKSKKG